MGRVSGKKRSKRALSLIEVGIALFLTSILLTIVLKFFFQIPILERKVEAVKQEFYPKEYTQVKLSSVFFKILPTNNLSKKSKKYSPISLYDTEKGSNPSLFLLFNNGIDQIPAFCGEVIGRIYIDDDKNLSLSVWPIGDKENYRKDILLPMISRVEWEFYDPKPENLEVDELDPKKKAPQWVKDWEGKESLPPMVRLTVTPEKGNEEKFHFFLSGGFDIITFQTPKTL